MVFFETSVFSKHVVKLLSEEEYSRLQVQLAVRPDSGVLIARSGGLRKIRCGIGGRGKRGGARVIYYWAVAQEQILMLFIYPKNAQEDLTQDQLRLLRRIVETEYS